jgi:DNA-binding PadR family transcriptional regulator
MAPALPAKSRKPRENRTRFVVLGMLTAGPMTGYALRQRIDGSVGHFWQESYGQLYPTLRQLAAQGLVEARATRGGPGRAGAAYHLTERGRAALADWVAQPPVMEPARNEILLKVFFGAAVSPAVLDGNLAAVAGVLRSHLAELEATAAGFDAAAGGHPDAPYWRLTLEFGLTFLRTGLGWIDHARKVIRAQPPRPRRGASARPEPEGRASGRAAAAHHAARARSSRRSGGAQ